MSKKFLFTLDDTRLTSYTEEKSRFHGEDILNNSKGQAMLSNLKDDGTALLTFKGLPFEYLKRKKVDNNFPHVPVYFNICYQDETYCYHPVLSAKLDLGDVTIFEIPNRINEARATAEIILYGNKPSLATPDLFFNGLDLSSETGQLRPEKRKKIY